MSRSAGPEPMSNQLQNHVVRMSSLTGARFVAATGVFLFHASPYFTGRDLLSSSLRAVGGQGLLGVDFFFVLSGFVLGWSQRPGEPVSRFYRRRFARIAPAYWVAFILGLGLELTRSSRPGADVKHALPSVVGLQAWFPQREVHFAADGVEWSVSAEVFFYLLFPALVLLCLRHRRLAFAVALGLGVVVPEGVLYLAHGDSASWLLLQCPAVRVGEFFCGVMAAVAMKRGWRAPVGHRSAIAIFAVYYVCLQSGATWLVDRGAALVMMLLVVTALAQRDIDGRPTWLANKLPVRLGMWSYAFYLVHQLVLKAAAAHVSHGGGMLDGALWVVLCFAVSIVLAGVIYATVERPAERLLRERRPSLGGVDGLAPRPA